MRRLVARQLVRLVVVLWAVTLATFLMLELLPGDQATAIAAGQNPLSLRPGSIDAIRADLGLDDPLPVRYVRWLGDVLQGDLGTSYRSGQDVTEVIASRASVTLEIGALAIGLAVVFAIPFGLLLAWRANGALDRAATGVTFAFLAIPEFLFALALVYVFAVGFGIFPTSGWTPISAGLGPHLRALVLPVASLAVGQLLIYARLLRTDVISTLQEDYIFAARAKGLTTPRILRSHALRPSLATLMTVAGLELAAVIGGAVLVESVFALPGLGRLLVDAVQDRDIFLVQGLTLLFAGFFVVVNIGIEIAHAALDPRVRLAEQHG